MVVVAVRVDLPEDLRVEEISAAKMVLWDVQRAAKFLKLSKDNDGGVVILFDCNRPDYIQGNWRADVFVARDEEKRGYKLRRWRVVRVKDIELLG